MHECLRPQQWHLPGIYNYRKAGRAAVIVNKIRKKRIENIFYYIKSQQ